jgi:hypothetical protein
MRPFLFLENSADFLGRRANLSASGGRRTGFARFFSRLLALGTMFGLNGAAAQAANPVHFASGPARVSLIELYTSEGCSSCPPAEQWLGQLRDQPGLWRDFVPVAFHVDYWNRLGWPDRFSKKEFTQREYDYSAAWSSDSVYTPCFVRDGAEWKARGVPSAASGSAVGTLTLDYDGATLKAEFVPAGKGVAGDFEVHIAVLGAGIVSKVTAGENRGETLKHDFIVLSLTKGKPGYVLPLVVPEVAGVPRHALAAWVTKRGSLIPVQATGGWLD